MHLHEHQPPGIGDLIECTLSLMPYHFDLLGSTAALPAAVAKAKLSFDFRAQ